MRRKRRRKKGRGWRRREKSGLQFPACPARAHPGNYNSQHAPRAVPGHRGPLPRSPITPGTPSTAQPDTCTGAVYSFHKKGHPRTGALLLCFDRNRGKAAQKAPRGLGELREQRGRSSGAAPSPGVSRCACLTVLLSSNHRNFRESFLCGPIGQISISLSII